MNASVDLLWAALVSAIVSSFVAYIFKVREVRETLSLNYELEQKEKLRNTIGLYHGPMLHAASRLSHRLWNLHEAQHRGWQTAKHPRSTSEYYFKTTVKRLLDFYSILVEIEEAAIHIDSRYAASSDFNFLNYCSALQHILSDTRIAKGMDYRVDYESDHLFSDNLREIVLRYRHTYSKETGEQDLSAFLDDPRNDSIVSYLDGIKSGEERVRWDRLICLHLLLLAFLDAFGHPRHKNPQSSFNKVARQCKNVTVVQNFANRLQYQDLESSASAGKIRYAAKCLSNKS